MVEYGIDKLLHGIPQDSFEPFGLWIETDGEYTVPWEVHAENLEEPATGSLELEVMTITEEGSPIVSLQELLPEQGDGAAG